MKRLALLLSLAVGVGAALLVIASPVSANHSWNGYHWARTSNPFTLKVEDDVTSNWTSYLSGAVSDWNSSDVLNMVRATELATSRNCQFISGEVRVCNKKYGQNGWLGIAEIYITGGEHITQGRVRLNDTYFNMATYNTPAWRQMVVCQEVGHTIGLDHQDETFNNANLGTCMDYTNDPDGGAGGADNNDPGNQHPNAHDYAELDTIYAHTDTFNSYASGAAVPGRGNGNAAEPNDPSAWGRLVASYNSGRTEVYERQEGSETVVTFVIWAEPRGQN